MQYYRRHLDESLKNHFKKYKEILVVLGARQTGKTTILKKIFPGAFYLTVDNESIRQNLERYDISVYRQIIPSTTEYVVIDEIHLLNDPGRAAKIIHDQLPQIKLIITGSSSLKIKHKSSESLAGRKIDYFLYPLTFSEYLYQKKLASEFQFSTLSNIVKQETFPDSKVYPFDIHGMLENVLLYGLYPAILNHPRDTLYLANLIDSVVFKDLLDLSLIENRKAALNLLRLLAYQIGSLVNISELANRLAIDTKTVKRYLSIFEQSFIIFFLYPYTQSKRDEIGKMPKIYFYDVGLRNALIDNFQPTMIRTDAGALFENFIISEVLKQNYYADFGLKMNFWRTKQGSEIDLVLKNEKNLWAVEIKTGSGKINTAFKKRYPHAINKLITRDNFY